MVSQEAKLSVGPIIVNLCPSLGTCYPLTSLNIMVQITLNSQRKWHLFSYIICMKMIIIDNIWRYGTLPNSNFQQENEKNVNSL